MVFTIKDKKYTNCIGIATNLEGISKILIDYIIDEILEVEVNYGYDFNIDDVSSIVNESVNESLKNFNLDHEYDSFRIKIDVDNKCFFDYFLFKIEIMKYQLNVYQ